MKKKSAGKLPWFVLWIIQILAMIILCAIASLSMFFGSAARVICLDILMPLISAFIAARCVYHGLNNYLALVAAPVVFPLTYLLIWGYPPTVAPFIICALVTVFGSAYGEIRRTGSHNKR